jgi:heme-degrading monooxygenase HmoA
MYVSLSRLHVPAERADALVRAFRARVRLVDGADGFVDLQGMRSDAHRVSHDRIDPELQAAIKLERLEHLHTYDVVAE